MNFGVIGYGYWGPNIVRNLASLEGSHVVGHCRNSAERPSHVHKRRIPASTSSPMPEEVITSTEIDAIAVDHAGLDPL